MNKTLFLLIRYSGLPLFFRNFIQKRKVTILMFHDISMDTADRTFAYLEKHYNIIKLKDFLDAHEQNDARKIPSKAMILTFDDGVLGNYELLPVIKKYNLPGSIFLCAGIIGTNRHFWFKFRHPDLSGYKLKELPNYKRLEILASTGFLQEKEFDTKQALTVEQIIEMRSFVDFQSHTIFHPCLPNCDDQEAISEIVHSKKILEEEFNFTVNAISYPNGDYSVRDIELVKKAGYKCGIAIDYGYNTISSDLFKLKRFPVNDTNNINELIVKASGSWAFFKRGALHLKKKKIKNNTNC